MAVVEFLPQGPLVVVSAHNGKVLEVAEDTAGGSVIVQSVDQGEKHQRWSFVSVAIDGVSDFYKIVNLHSGLALGIEYESPEDGATVLQRAYPQGHEALHMQWQPVSEKKEKNTFYRIINRRSQKVLDIEGGETGSSEKKENRIIQWTYWGGSNQRWRIIFSPPGSRIESPSQLALEGPAGTLSVRSKALSLMRPIFGWFSEEEAELLLAIAVRALRDLDDCAVVEIGSYLGRSTVLLASVVRDLRPSAQVVAIDPHVGVVSVADGIDQSGVPTYEAFCANLDAAGLSTSVRAIRQCSTDVSWDQPIGLLFIDGLHDYKSVSADFGHFKQWIKPGGFVAFHDYAYYWPGVVQLVDEAWNSCHFQWVDRVGSLVVLRKCSGDSVGSSDGCTAT